MKSRLDRFLSVGLSHPMSRILNRSSSARIPILMYHSISTAMSFAHPYFETCTSPQTFADQMQFLRDHEYESVDLSETLTSITPRLPSSQKQVVITFDDGYRDFFDAAFPILKAHGFSATVFVVSDFANQQRTSGKSRTYMNWSEIRHIHSCGMRIGSHTMSHPELRKLNAEQIVIELKHSKDVIEDCLGATVQSFSYPYAFPEQDSSFVDFIRSTLVRCGYKNGVSTIIGRSKRQSDHFFLPRLPVNTYDDKRLLQVKLEGGYDWMHVPQYLSKYLRGMPSRTLSENSIVYRQ